MSPYGLHSVRDCIIAATAAATAVIVTINDHTSATRAAATLPCGAHRVAGTVYPLP